MLVCATLDHVPEQHTPAPFCLIEKAVVVSNQEFAAFLAAPRGRWDFISDNDSVMYTRNGVNHCLLVLSEDRRDGVLVSGQKVLLEKEMVQAYLPNAREIVGGTIQGAVEWIIERGAMFSANVESQQFFFEELGEYLGLQLATDNGIGPMLLEALKRRPEIASAEMEDAYVEIVLSPDCRMVMTGSQPEEPGQPRPTDQLVNKILDYLAEHDGSEALYQMLHTDLGFTNAEIDALGFDLSHRFEDEPGINQPQL